MFSLHKSNTKGVGFNKIIRRVHKNWYFKDVTWVKNLKWAHHCFFKRSARKQNWAKKHIKFAFEIYTYFQGGTESWGPPSFFFFFEFVKITQFTQPHYYSYLMLPPWNLASAHPAYFTVLRWHHQGFFTYDFYGNSPAAIIFPFFFFLFIFFFFQSSQSSFSMTH